MGWAWLAVTYWVETRDSAEHSRYTEQLSQQRITPSKMSVALRLRNPAVGNQFAEGPDVLKVACH